MNLEFIAPATSCEKVAQGIKSGTTDVIGFRILNRETLAKINRNEGRIARTSSDGARGEEICAALRPYFCDRKAALPTLFTHITKIIVISSEDG